MDSLDKLAAVIAEGLPGKEERESLAERTAEAIDAVFGERYPAKAKYARRVVLMPADDNVSFAGLLHPDNPTSGVYGGMSLIWFPVAASDDRPASTLLTLVCGTRGLSPDEHIMGRPGHVRHLRALQRHLAKECKTFSWIKPDPTDLNDSVPKVAQQKLPQFTSIFKRYGHHIYACVEVPKDAKSAREIVGSFFDFYAWEREWAPLKKFTSEVEEMKLSLRGNMFPRTDIEQVYNLLMQRRFVILQGPPGTGKTRMATQVLIEKFGGSGFSVQFHPAVSYETFVSGISPSVEDSNLSFQVKSGWLLDAINECDGKPYLLHVDEINRADLSRVLGEAIYLFEPREIAEGASRKVRLQNATSTGERELSIPDDLFLLGTMNSADRSIAIMDMAVRRRFAFVDVWPDIDVVRAQGIELATEAFAQIQDIFCQYASDDSFNLLPGHSYFLAADEDELKNRFRYELIPLLHEYLQEGRLASCETELRAYIDWLGSEIEIYAK